MGSNYPPRQHLPQQWRPDPRDPQGTPRMPMHMQPNMQYPYQQQPPQWQHNHYPQTWQQQPHLAVTRKPITFAEHLLHFLLCFPTCGLWIFVWIGRAAAGRKERTVYR
jgi:hypothetical protein